MTFLAFLGVVFLGSIVLTVVALLAKIVLGVALFWAPFGIKVRVGSLLAGAVGAVAVGGFSYWLFQVAADKSPASLVPLAASAFALLIPFFNDHRKGKELGAAAAQLPESLQAAAAPAAIGLPLQAAGYLLGLALVVAWHFAGGAA